MSGGSGSGRTIPSFKALIQYCTGTGSFEADAYAAIAMFRVGSGDGCGSRVGFTFSIRAGLTLSSHSTRSIATLRRKWPPPFASAVWYTRYHFPLNSMTPGCDVVDETGS